MPTMSTKPQEEVLEGEECCFPCWKTLPDDILLHIFRFLGAPSLYVVGLVCKAWLRVAFDEFLWKDLFYNHWKISRSIPMAPGKYSWVQEYKRFLYHTPEVESETLKHHSDQVLHISFSHNGKMFATCSKDGFIRVWDTTTYPTSLKHNTDMRKITWKYTQFSQFNESDTLLLVSGVHFGSLNTSGDIAVFSFADGEFIMQSRVLNKPYDVFGTWYNDLYLLSGNLHWTGHMNSCSVLWLNKAYQETTSEEESVVMRLYKFSNINASSIRTIMISNCLSDESELRAERVESVSSIAVGQDSANEKASSSNSNKSPDIETRQEKDGGTKGKHPPRTQSVQVYENGCFCTKLLEVDSDEGTDRLNGTIKYSQDYRMVEQLPDDCTIGKEIDGASDSDENMDDICSRLDIAEAAGTSGVNVTVNVDIEIHQPVVPETVLLDTNELMTACVSFEPNQPSSGDMEVTFNCQLGCAEIETRIESDTECNIDMSDDVTTSSDSSSKKRQLAHAPGCDNAPVNNSENLGDFDEIALQEYLCSTDFPSLTFCCVDNKKQKVSTMKTPKTDIYHKELNKEFDDLPSEACASPCSISRQQHSSTSCIDSFNRNISQALDTQIPCSSTAIPNTVEPSTSSMLPEPIYHTDVTLPLFAGSTASAKNVTNNDKYLIFTKGSKTYTPHQIGIKRVKPLKSFSADGRILLPNVSENMQGLDRPEDDYDTVDHLIDMHGHIIGMSLAPDHRYLYVNSRPWPQNYVIENPLYPPPIAQEIDIHVIDLVNMREVGTMHRAHKAYTSNDECFFIFLDVCEEYVASGAEDKHGYLWDRHYGLCLHKYPHTDVVNSVAFNPADPEVLVTVSDDFSIKVWRSRAREKEVTTRHKELVVESKAMTDSSG